jgi:hypothetical protein
MFPFDFLTLHWHLQPRTDNEVEVYITNMLVKPVYLELSKLCRYLGYHKLFGPCNRFLAQNNVVIIKTLRHR